LRQLTKAAKRRKNADDGEGASGKTTRSPAGSFEGARSSAAPHIVSKSFRHGWKAETGQNFDAWSFSATSQAMGDKWNSPVQQGKSVITKIFGSATKK